MTAKGQVWIEVKDSKGVVLVQRTLQAKEVVNVSGQPPLAVVVGRINEMQSIEVRGKPFSLAGLSPDNVARFEVK
jgi:cytoskeleton protein RodZ